MNETPKNKSGWRMRDALKIWLIFIAIVGATQASADWIQYKEGKLPPVLFQGCLCVAIATSATGLWLGVRWLNCWHNVRRALVGLAILATLIAIFYTEEDWRGKRAWKNCKRELEAKGAVLDWNAYIPPPVPDDQNFFTASKKIAFSFVHSRNDAESEFFAKQPRFQFSPTETNTFPVFDNAKSKPLIVAELSVLPFNGANLESPKHHLVMDFNSVGAREQVQSLIETTIGQSIHGAAGFQFSEFQLGNLVPAQIFVKPDSAPSIGDLESFIPAGTTTNIGHLRIEATVDKNIFHVVLTGVHITAAADYLKWSDQYVPAFDEVREALKRPYTIIPGDYSVPYLMPIPNFVTMRALAQTLAQRAQCDFLLGKPDDALHELTLIHDVCRILEKPPTGKPETLVEAMINVSISGLYTSTVADGFRLNVWREPQMTALQEQFKAINIAPFVFQAFKNEQAHTVYLGSRTDFRKLMTGELFGYGHKKTFMQKLEAYAYDLMPQGWVFQNLVVATQIHQQVIDTFDPLEKQVFPKQLEAAYLDATTKLERHSVFHLLADIAIPNYSKVFQTLAYTQTLVNEAQIACALERYNQANGNYPETLDALVPQFMEKIPHDIIGGEPMHYRRTDDGKFLLYSVGWNETDDGGQVVLTKGGSVDREKGDWVWQYPQN